MPMECGCEPCDNCYGAQGWIEFRGHAHFNLREVWVDCPRCNGTGHEHPEECPMLEAA